ncbi:uncharacterized protein LOC144634825 isoform X2 [Oculina patagonica]
MGPKIKKNTIYAKVLDRKIVMVEISIHPECLQVGQSLKENKANIYKWFTKEHFDRLILKLQDVILAKVLAPSEPVGKKKSGKASHGDYLETLPDPELLIQYKFVKKRNHKQMVLTRQKQESVVDGLRKKSGYSGGGYQSHGFFPEKLNVTVSLASQVAHQMPSVAGVIQDAEEKKPGPSKSTISKYFNKDTATVTRSTQKKRAALKNMNKKDEQQTKIDSLLCSNSSVDDKVALKEEKTENATCCVESEGDTPHKHDQISWVNKLGNKIEIQDVLAFQEGESSKVKKEDEHDNDILLRGGDEIKHVPSDSSESCSIASGLSPKSEEFKASLCSEDVESWRHLKNCETVSHSKDLDTRSTGTTTSKFKRRRSQSESDSTDIDSIPSLRNRLSKRNTLKKPKTLPDEETTGNRREIDVIIERTGDDKDFESPKARRNVGKRKGSDLSDDQDLYTSVFSTTSETAASSNQDAKEGLNSKKRKTKKTDTRVDVSERKVKNPAEKRIYKRRVKATTKTTADVLEDAGEEEPGSSPLEPITIEDKPPVPINVSTIEELTAEQTEQLVWEHASKLREIFEGKKYCRRHEDYKRGGKMKGDLAFQVLFGPFSEEQRDRIMGVLTNMFCYKHSKYFDYVSKVLLPEALVMLYMKVVGRSRDEAEHSLLEAPASAN